MIKDLAYECAKYFAEDAVQVVLHINGYSMETKSQYNVLEFLEEVPIFIEYELYFTRAVSVALYKFNNEVKLLTSIIWKDVMATEEEKRKNEFFRRILQSVPGYYTIYPERIFVFIAVIGELCVNCYASEMEYLIPMALLAARCFLTRILQRVSSDTCLNMHKYVTSFLSAYDISYSDKGLKISPPKFTVTKV